MRDGWQERRLGQVLRRRTDRLGNAAEPRILTVTEGRGLVDQLAHWGRRVATEDVSGYKVVDPGDVVYNIYLLWSGAIGQNVFPDRGVTSPVYEVFTPRSGVEPRYLGLLLQSPMLRGEYDGISIGSIQRRRRAPWQDFERIAIQLPSLPEQQRIVDLIGALDGTISAAQSAHQCAVALLNEVRKPRTADGSSSLGDLVTMRSGPSWKAADESPVPVPGALPVLGITNTPRGTEMDLRQVSFVGGLSRSVQTLTEHSLVMIRTNGNRHRIGNIYRATPEVIGFGVSAFQIAIEPNNPNDSGFLYWYLGCPDVQTAITRNASGTTGLGNIAVGWLKNLTVPALAPRDRAEYVAVCEATGATVVGLAAVLDRAKKARLDLVTLLLSGEHQIPDSYDEWMGEAS